MPVVTVPVAATVDSVGTEVDEPRAVRGDRIERRRPVVTVGTHTAEIRSAPVTGGGKEYTVPVGRFNQSTVDSAAIVVRYPSPGALGP